MTELILFPAAFGLTYFGVGILRNWSIKKGIIDIPNERSSHNVPTPSGGGVVIVAVVLVFYLGITFLYPATFSWGYLFGALLVAVVSWLDDIYSVSFIWRSITHVLAAVFLIVEKGFWSEIYFPGISSALHLGVFGAIVTCLWIVWLVNAYNFMDGIDGIAGLQAVIAGLAWLVIGLVLGNTGIYFLGGIIFCASIGFLIHNWHPARIFMGDVGSAFLGYTFAAIPLLSRRDSSGDSSILPITSILLVWFFLFDPSFTGVRRTLRGEKVWVASREHLYQKLVISGISHAFVSSIYGSLTLLLSIAVLLAIKYKDGFEVSIYPIMFILTSALMYLCLKRRALT